MEKNLLLKSLLFVSTGLAVITASAQITITRNDFADIGDMTISAHDSVPSVTPGSAGAAQTWDLSAIANHYSDTTVFSSPSSTPYAANFPASNLAGFNTTDSAYYFANANSNSIDVVGYVAPNPFTGGVMLLPFIPPQPQITFPSTLATSFSSNSTANGAAFYFSFILDSLTNTVVDSVRLSQTINRNSIVDGWGTAIIPSGTFASLRQRVVDSTSTLVEAFVRIGIIPLGWQPFFTDNSVTTNYYYLANGQKWAVAQLGTDSAGNVTDAQYLMNTIIGIEEFYFAGNNDVVIYPNPSTGTVNISVLTNNAVALEVYDMLGKKTETISFEQATVNHSFESYATGIYTFRVLNKDGTPISAGKFVIEK